MADEKKFCSVPFTELMISINKKGQTCFSPCCFNRSNYTSFKAKTIKDALNSKEMRLFRENSCNNRLKLCPEDCRFWKPVSKYPGIKSSLQRVQLNLGTRCNLRCIFCYQTDANQKVSPLIFDEFRKYYLPNIKRICLTGGEPLIVAKDLIDLILAKYPKIKIDIVTNGVLLDNYIKFKKRFYEISVSINAGTREVYKKITGADCFDRVVSNISKLRPGFKGWLHATFILCRENMNDAENFLRLCSRLKIKDCEISMDNTDPFLKVPSLLKKRLKTAADKLKLNCRLSRLDNALNKTKRIKQALSYLAYYAPRRMLYRCKRGIRLF